MFVTYLPTKRVCKCLRWKALAASRLTPLIRAGDPTLALPVSLLFMEDAVAKPSPQREAVQKLLGEKFKVHTRRFPEDTIDRSVQVDVKDGRVFVGQFYCLDAAGSLILMDAYELESASLLGRPPNRSCTHPSRPCR